MSDVRLQMDGENFAHGLAYLVASLLDLVRQLLERQAIRRMENGDLSDDDIERVGQGLMRLREELARIKDDLGVDVSRVPREMTDLIEHLELSLEREATR